MFRLFTATERYFNGCLYSKCSNCIASTSCPVLSSTQRSRQIGTYKVKITTSTAYKEKSFDGRIFLKLIGSNGDVTDQKEITKYFKPGELNGQTYNLELQDVGVPEFVWFDLVPSSCVDDEWACDDIFVTYEDTTVRFPIYDWIKKDLKAVAGKAYTYTQANPKLKAIRTKEIENAKTRFRWIPKADNEEDVGWGTPRYVDAKTESVLPKILKRKSARMDDILRAGVHAVFGTLVGCIKAQLLRWTGRFSLDDFKKVYQSIKGAKDPRFMDRWKTDKEFGRQQIMGVTPLALKRLINLPNGCGITNEIVSDVLGGESLEEEIQEGKIFIGDYSTVFKGVTRNKNIFCNKLYCPDAVGLFHADKDGDLVPIAIQLVPDDYQTIFTPKDREEDWMLAKMYYRVAASNLHEWYCHFLMTHNVMEPFAVALFRNLPRSHPLYKLLRPHLQTVTAINTDARGSLMGPKALPNKALAILGIDLVRSTYKNFEMSDLILPKVLNNRGLDDTDAIPKNYFRDDAMKLWSVINKFAGSIVNLYYSSDEDVVCDDELQAFAKDVAIDGLGWQEENGHTKGMTTDIQSLEKLIELCTTVIYTSSVAHAAVNFPQFENYQFVPNSPVAMRLPPHKKGQATKKRILDSLPNLATAAQQIIIASTLSKLTAEEIYLGNYPMGLFTDHDAQAVIKTFKEDLETVENEINERNEAAGNEAHTFLRPSRIPNSIAV